MTTLRCSAIRTQVLPGLVLVGSLLSTHAAGQSAPGPIDPSSALRFDVPIHDETGPDGTTVEVWASRERYKVSFHDGIAFYPVLGTAYARNLPVTWRTTSIRAGDRELLADGVRPVATSASWRYELRHGAVVEAYDVREDGLEQTFVLGAPLAAAGDLVIRGALSTDLVADAMPAPAHGELLLRDARGHPIVAYGAATVIDAAGDAARVATGFDGGEITLRIDGDWLADAAYPVVVDPLLSSRVVLTATSSSKNPSIARSRGSRVLVMDARAVSASDYDTMGVSVVGAFGSPALIFSLVSASMNTPHTRAAYVEQADRWCIAMEVHRRVFLSDIKAIGWHLRRPSDTTFRSVSNQLITGTDDAQPVVGGDAGGLVPGDNALIVFKRGSGAGSAIHGAVIDCASDALLTTRRLSETSAVRCEFPDVIEQVEMRIDPWVAVWQEEGANQRRQLRMTWVFNDGNQTNVYPLGHQADLTRHNFKPKVDGNGGEYAVAFLAHSVGGTIPPNPVAAEIWIDSIRLNYIAGTTVGKRHLPLHELRSGFNFSTSDVAFDTETRSHWGIAYEWRFLTGSSHFVRIGFDGKELESFTITNGIDGIGATYLPTSHSYAIAYSDGTVLRGCEATYPVVPAPTQIGQPCGFATLDSDTSHAGRPYAGKERFELRISPVSQQMQGALLLGVQPVDVPFLGCRLYVNPLLTVPFATPGTQEYEIPLSFPSAIEGPLVAQILYLTTSTGQFGATNGYSFTIVR